MPLELALETPAINAFEQKTTQKSTKTGFLLLTIFAIAITASPLIAKINNAPIILAFSAPDQNNWQVYNTTNTPDNQPALSSENNPTNQTRLKQKIDIKIPKSGEVKIYNDFAEKIVITL